MEKEIERKYLIDKDLFNQIINYEREEVDLKVEKVIDTYYKQKKTLKTVRIRECFDNYLLTVKTKSIRNSTEENIETELNFSKDNYPKILQILQYLDMTPWFRKSKLKYFFQDKDCDIAIEEVWSDETNIVQYALEFEVISEDIHYAHQKLDEIEKRFESTFEVKLIPECRDWKDLLN